MEKFTNYKSAPFSANGNKVCQTFLIDNVEETILETYMLVKNVYKVDIF